ncbi:hypothetical protein TNIN_377771 [Trichonephila inaurata madagascariensis]|uniref:Uncharacterized protein n=1 Tax=Trichonephila inaurata madagascariensis TaxID=2747483 RepID=A0A8X6YBL9_9ARAC|nr:hypothetical protein TNIN_377771 [Trichonephila inaurata madagascariensis]
MLMQSISLFKTSIEDRDAADGIIILISGVVGQGGWISVKKYPTDEKGSLEVLTVECKFEPWPLETLRNEISTTCPPTAHLIHSARQPSPNQTVERVNQLREENEMLEAKIKILTKELSFLKDLFLAHAGSAHGQNLTDAELSYLKDETDHKAVIASANQSA